MLSSEKGTSSVGHGNRIPCLACCYIRIPANNALTKDGCGNGKHWEGNDDRTDRDERQASVRMAKGADSYMDIYFCCTVVFQLRCV